MTLQLRFSQNQHFITFVFSAVFTYCETDAHGKKKNRAGEYVPWGEFDFESSYWGEKALKEKLFSFTIHDELVDKKHSHHE